MLVSVIQAYSIHVQLHTSRDEESVACCDVALVALGDLVPEEYLTLVGGHDPLLVLEQILFSWRNKVEHLLSLDIDSGHNSKTGSMIVSCVKTGSMIVSCVKTGSMIVSCVKTGSIIVSCVSDDFQFSTICFVLVNVYTCTCTCISICLASCISHCSM